MTLLLRCTLQYHGERYLGWQETSEGPSIQGTLRQILEKMAQAPIEIEAASRTDAGVHAKGQVVGLWLPSGRYAPERWISSLQNQLPRDIGVTDWELAPSTWHPTLDVVGKAYRYQVSLRRAPLLHSFLWELPGVLLQEERMRTALEILHGAHDFTAFATDLVDHPIRNPICNLRHLSLESSPQGIFSFTFVGDRFLYKMCRTLVGTLVDIGRNRIPLEDLESILQSRLRSRSGICAPPQGLCLEKVFYKELDLQQSIEHASSLLCLREFH